MIKENEIINIQNFLNYDDFYTLRNTRSKTLPWYFEGRASYTMAEWHLNHPIYGGKKSAITDFNDLIPEYQIPLLTLSKKYNVLIHPYDIYFNCYKFGNEMEIHTDKKTKEGFNRTIIVYLTDDWFPQWHGETVFYDQNAEHVRQSIVPYSNSAAIFDSRIPHTSAPISKFCLINRTIIVYQCQIELIDD